MPKLTNWSINSIYKKLRVNYSNTSGKFPETPLALLKIRFFESLMLKGCLKEQNIVLNPKKEIDSIQNHNILQHSNTQSSKRSVKKINPGDINHFHKKSRKNLTDEDQRRKILRMGIEKPSEYLKYCDSNDKIVQNNKKLINDSLLELINEAKKTKKTD